jgi:protein disulfide-isomerase A6
LKGQVKLGKVDATVESGLAQRFGVQGYPTIKIFDYGVENKKDSKAIPYNGDRTAAAITSAMMELAEKADIEPELLELVSQKTYDKNCEGAVICVLAFLPNIYDSSAKERNDYLDLLTQVAKKNRKSPFKWFWL